MKIIVRSFAMIREGLGRKRLKFEIKEDASITDFLVTFNKQYPDVAKLMLDDGELSKNYVIAVNGEEVGRDEFHSYQLEEGVELAIIPPAGGG